MIVNFGVLLGPLVVLGLVSKSLQAGLRYEQRYTPVAGSGIEVLKTVLKIQVFWSGRDQILIAIDRILQPD